MSWEYNTNRMNVNGIDDMLYTLYNKTTSYDWNSIKTYQFEIQVFQFSATSASFSITTYWEDSLGFNQILGTTPSSSTPTTLTQSLFLYSSPLANSSSAGETTFVANSSFSGNTGIYKLIINELDLKIQGFAFHKITGLESDIIGNLNTLGWYYNKTNDQYQWHDRVDGINTQSSIIQADHYPVGGANEAKRADFGYRLNNYIGKFIQYSSFNMNFEYYNNSNFPLKIYLSPSLPSTTPSSWTEFTLGKNPIPSNSLLVATLTQSHSSTQSDVHSFYGLKGGQYIYFVGGFCGATSSSATYSNIILSNITVDGGYNVANNRRYEMDSNMEPLGISNATYSSVIGSGNTVNASQSMMRSKIVSKLGNGTFKSGVWENGVWNSGWRVDESMYEFSSIYQFFSYNTDKRWRVQIIGPTSSVNKFTIGDNVSISNIVAIDINDDRKLLKNYFTIINKLSNSIIVEFDSEFPLRRIEIDSEYHRIHISKNVWLSGGFLNGYFTGIWNYGLFKGYPLITEMYNSHWIDGIFDGGHFHSASYSIPNFIDTVYTNGKVGLTFGLTAHGLLSGDTITINKTDKSINPQYDGEQVISVVDNYTISTNLEWGQDSMNESGSITTKLSKGLLQKVDFKSNNISKITSKQSLDSEAIFVYNSWMDVNYDNTSAVNIGKTQKQINTLTNKSYSENNLYGYPTNDVLSSNSSFRDSFSTNVRKYKLGTKYKIFSDFIGDSGKFEEYFDDKNPSLFTNQGWTYSKSSLAFNLSVTSSISFNRVEFTEDNLYGGELKVTTTGYGGVLDISNSTEDILNRSYENIEKSRYTMVEFGVATYSRANFVDYFNPVTRSSYEWNIIPMMYFNNLNVTYVSMTQSLNYSYTYDGQTYIINTVRSYDKLVDNTYLPIYKNVNHLLTSNTRKVEYFFNKTNLSMHFQGSSNASNITSSCIIDNLHFYEVDMIPFFQYFTYNNINKSIQIPYQGISPFIDYSNNNFSFIDNISIGLDSLSLQNSYTAISGVGIGIGNSMNIIEYDKFGNEVSITDGDDIWIPPTQIDSV